VSLPGWDAAAQAQLEKGIVRPVVFFRMATPTPLRLWSGAGPFAVPSDTVEPGGATYEGVGDLVGLPAVQQLINGQADRVQFALSGATAEMLAMADEEAADIRAAEVRLGFCALDAAWQPLAPVVWLWSGEADSIEVQRTAAEGGEVARTMSLSVGSIFTGRRRASPSYYSDAEQRRRSADDRFCERVSIYSAGSTKDWPN
jgi:hypothetical protein